MKKIFITLLLLAGFYVNSKAQAIETRMCFADTTAFPFSGEWQYLSTDIFLFNGHQFDKVINDIYLPSTKKGRKRILANEKLEYLYITAQLMNVKYFGDNDVVYPLYNFQISNENDSKYQTFVSENIEAIRIIDNLPLYSAGNNIDAKIDVKALTSSDKDNIMGFFGKQLQNLAQTGGFGKPILALIGEMGNFIESNAKKKEYRFSSTIRLFEQKNFDTRLHSIRIYMMVTPNTPTVRMNTAALAKFMDTCTVTELTKGDLEKLLPYRTYPLIVVANYKSLYQLDGISGDEVNFANIDKRKVNVENNYRDKLISDETYRQEKTFTDFLTIFANFKSQIELYTLNARTGNIDAANNALGSIVQSYVGLLTEYNLINFKYRDNNIFIKSFKSEYASIIDFASYYLENDPILRGMKVMCTTLIDLNRSGIPLKPADQENALRNLRHRDNISGDFNTKTKEGQNIATLVQQMENSLFAQEFNPLIAKLNSTPVTEDVKDENFVLLSEKMSATSCQICRDRAQDAIKHYYNRLEDVQKANRLKEYTELARNAEMSLFNYGKTLVLLKNNINRYPQGSMEFNTYSRRIAEIERDINNIKDIVAVNMNDKNSQAIESVNAKILNYTESVNANIEFIRQNSPALLEEPKPEEPQPEAIKTDDANTAVETGGEEENPCPNDGKNAEKQAAQSVFRQIFR
ncbi:MAG: hypothetical protein LBQ70_04535 [Prevotellaceae bacterium]|jgi:hypothetical protein|nr:hypothetical protein [Prevotellaceae bacterium]